VLPKRIFFTGVPGSRWSGIGQWIEETVPGFTTSDRTENRQFEHSLGSTYKGMPVHHKGAYFGRGMEFEAKLNDSDYLDSPWQDKIGTRLIKSHEWALQLDNIKELYPDDWIIMVYRPDEISSAWWHQAGGFKIKYPDYSAYGDSINMNNSIRLQNKAILEFGKKHDAVWYHVGKKFLKTEFDIDVEPFSDFFYDNLITVIR
jgi:hypothetical protein